MFKKIIVIITSFIIIIALALTNALLVNPSQITIRKQTLESDKISKNLDGFQIAFITDLHYGTYVDDQYLAKLIDKLNKFKPDLILFGGDLIDKYSKNSINQNQREYLINSLKSLNAKCGKYAVLGNHDISSNDIKQDIISILIQADFIILENENTTISVGINEYFNLIGIDSVTSDNSNISSLFYGINNEHYTMCISHYPDTFDDIFSYNFDYLLAGHSHGGQVYIPLISLFNREIGCNNYFRGKYTKDNKTLDISNGVGLTRYKARLFADNEIVLYQFKTSTTK